MYLRDSNYSFTAVDPRSTPYDDYLAAAELTLHTFQYNKFFQWRFGPALAYGDDLDVVRTTIMDPRARLEAFVARATGYRTLCHYLARLYRRRVMKEGVWQMFSVKDTDGQMVAFAMWAVQYMKFPVPENYSAFENLRWWVYKTLLLKVYDWKDWRDYGSFNPVRNARLFACAAAEDKTAKELGKEPKKEEELALLSYDELKGEIYPFMKTVFLNTMIVSPKMQRQGIGSKFFEAMFAYIPEQRVEFKAGDTVTYGPQKFMCHATNEGRGLYSKVGFDSLFSFEFDCAEHGIDQLTVMQMTVKS